MSTATALNVNSKSHGFFDQYGRLIPTPGRRVYSQVSRRYFAITQPEIDYARIHANSKTYLGTDGGMTASEFEKKCKKILDTVRSDARMSDLLNAVYIPFICPQFGAADLGKTMDEKFLPAVGKSFTKEYKDLSFTNHYAGQLSEKLTVVPGCRYEKLMSAAQTGPVVGIYFPNCLSEYAIPDQRELVSTLPPQYILSGPFESACAFVGVPGILTRKDLVYPPLLALSSVEPKDKNFFYHFESYGWNLTFNRRSMIGPVSEYWAGGLTLI